MIVLTLYKEVLLSTQRSASLTDHRYSVITYPENIFIHHKTPCASNLLARMVKLTSAVLLVTAVSALPSSWVRRDVNTVLNNLGTIDTETDALTTSVDAWDGSFFGALGIASASNTLGTAIDSANTEAATEAQLSSADTQTFITCTQPRPLSPHCIMSLW